MSHISTHADGDINKNIGYWLCFHMTSHCVKKYNTFWHTKMWFHNLILSNNSTFHLTVMSELLFECYGVPSVCYGVDGLFSFQHNHPKCTTALIINCGYHTTHILPVINNQVDPTRSRRINVGGINIINYLHRLLQLKYPAHFTAITPSRAEVCET